MPSHLVYVDHENGLVVLDDVNDGIPHDDPRYLGSVRAVFDAAAKVLGVSVTSEVVDLLDSPEYKAAEREREPVATARRVHRRPRQVFLRHDQKSVVSGCSPRARSQVGGGVVVSGWRVIL